jgi:PAS domain S-box-containing protein
MDLRTTVEMALYKHRADTRLRESESRWKFAVEGAGDGLWDWDLDHDTVYYSQRWQQLLGYANGELGTSIGVWEQVLHPDERDHVRQRLQDHLEGRDGQFCVEHRARCQDGSWKWIDDRALVVRRDADGKPVRLIGRYADITARIEENQRLAAAYARVRNLELTLNEHAIVAITDRFGTITYANDKFCAISHYQREELIGQTHRLINSGYHPRSFIADLWATISSGAIWKGEIKNRARDGSYYWVDTTLVPFLGEDGVPYEYFAIRRDITQQKELELALRHSADQLRELSTRQMSLREEVRKNVARDIHDNLGGQLNGIKSYLSVLIGRASHHGQPPDPLLLDMAQMADDAIETVCQLITELRPSILDQLGVWAALDWYAGQIGQRTALRCLCQIDDPVHDWEADGDTSTAIFRIVQELVSNVIRHAQATQVTISVHADSSGLVVSVADDGIGIDSGKVLDEKSWGIIGMFERSLPISGELTITRAAAGGTIAQLRLPKERFDVL